MIETMKIVSDIPETNGFIIINKEDFEPNSMKEFVEPKVEKSKPESKVEKAQ